MAGNKPKVVKTHKSHSPIWGVAVFFAIIWLIVRIIVWMRNRRINWKREAVLLLMFIDLAVIIRFVFFPRDLVDGHVQSLVFDPQMALPLRINLVPLVYLFDYETTRNIIWNIVGNTAMFIPSGIVLPIVYREIMAVSWECISISQLVTLIMRSMYSC